jgi:hypothetical protein
MGRKELPIIIFRDDPQGRLSFFIPGRIEATAPRRYPTGMMHPKNGDDVRSRPGGSRVPAPTSPIAFDNGLLYSVYSGWGYYRHVFYW